MSIAIQLPRHMRHGKADCPQPTSPHSRLLPRIKHTSRHPKNPNSKENRYTPLPYRAQPPNPRIWSPKPTVTTPSPNPISTRHTLLHAARCRVWGTHNRKPSPLD
ncbi:hypothetical protein GQ44DRAFT_709906 [Phaeosphaeriaceae sp. PMI808]|nr:hypothetical protein GQ44DRAFT_709906 [Phaeosphaeriaceae sp. PMI808]